MAKHVEKQNTKSLFATFDSFTNFITLTFVFISQNSFGGAILHPLACFALGNCSPLPPSLPLVTPLLVARDYLRRL